jgi:hypothetical protein
MRAGAKLSRWFLQVDKRARKVEVVEGNHDRYRQAMGDRQKMGRQTPQVVEMHYSRVFFEQGFREKALQAVRMAEKSVRIEAAARQTIEHSSIGKALANGLGNTRPDQRSPGYDTDRVAHASQLGRQALTI